MSALCGHASLRILESLVSFLVCIACFLGHGSRSGAARAHGPDVRWTGVLAEVLLLGA